MIALGCAKNMVDAEIMLGALATDGIEVTNDPAAADAVIVNTCSFIHDAQEESVDAVLESDALRQARQPAQALIVAGCLPQRFQKELPSLLPEVDAFMGIDQVSRVAAIVREAVAKRAGRPQDSKPAAPAEKPRARTARGKSRSGPAPEPPLVKLNLRPSFVPDYATPRFRLTPRHFAYLKIAEGCNHPCSFCIIPRIRGTHRSRPVPDLIAEARQMLAEGVKELNLISQDSTYYGLDLRPARTGSLAAPGKFQAATRALPASVPTLSTLLRALEALPGDFWIRILYTHPAHWTDELIEAIQACPKVVRYIDIPLQHIHEPMLSRMRRETSKEYIVDLLRRLRTALPGVTLRTTFIVGFPGETEAAFQELLQFIQTVRFERLGVFTYSQEEGTVAGRMKDQITAPVKEERRARAMAAQLTIARKIAASCVGRVIKVLAEAQANQRDLHAAQVFSWEHGLIRSPESALSGLGSKTYLVARGEADAPDIDGRVYLRGRAPLGQFAQARIVGHTDYDLIGEVV
jgi:ribosomal protein S12 methylthiotransferase